MSKNGWFEGRRFEFIGGNSCKFWEISVRGPEVSVRFGRIGSSGQTHIKRFADPGLALQHAEKLIQEKLGKGYQEIESQAA
jgi:predicted DNA-binding WGR domain protein